jgi:hypothetical protein
MDRHRCGGRPPVKMSQAGRKPGFGGCLSLADLFDAIARRVCASSWRRQAVYRGGTSREVWHASRLGVIAEGTVSGLPGPLLWRYRRQACGVL